MPRNLNFIPERLGDFKGKIANKFMNDIAKDIIRRAFAKLGVRFQKAYYLPYSYERRIYPKAISGNQKVIFDVGGNIGQSSIWYAREFPDARIHTFEPFLKIYELLEKNTRKNPKITAHRIGLGSKSGDFRVMSVPDPFWQVGNIREVSGDHSSELITVETIDEFCANNQISSIDILKTDTEGFDLEVLKGARRMLEEGRISAILSEATIDLDDAEHTQLSDLTSMLSAYGFVLHGLYDLHHIKADGGVSYFNALFVVK